MKRLKPVTVKTIVIGRMGKKDVNIPVKVDNSLGSSASSSLNKSARPQETYQNVVVLDEAADQEPSPYCSSRLINATLNWEKSEESSWMPQLKTKRFPMRRSVLNVKNLPPSDADIVVHIRARLFES